jgi:hypothetical protein
MTAWQRTCPTRFLIAKGWEGFGDRLECLSYAILSAKRFNRVLYVDWTDTIWGEGFYRYFHFVNLPYVDQLSDIDVSLSVWPSFWKHKLMLPANQWVQEQPWKDANQFKPLEGKHWEDVWVQVANGYREWDVKDLSSHLRLKPEIVEEIGEIPTDMPVVHLRGTDRPFTEDEWEAVRQQAPVARVISDDASLVERWASESPESVIQSRPQAGVNHKTIGQKHESNIALLRDFLILSKAPEAFALNEKSTFFKRARTIDTNPWITAKEKT